jgi:hypothetical protein
MNAAVRWGWMGFVFVFGIGLVALSGGMRAFVYDDGGEQSFVLTLNEMEQLVAGDPCSNTLASTVKCILPGGAICGMGPLCVSATFPGSNPWRCYRVVTRPTLDCVFAENSGRHCVKWPTGEWCAQLYSGDRHIIFGCGSCNDPDAQCGDQLQFLATDDVCSGIILP